MAGSHLDDHQLLDLAMGRASPEEANSGQDHCSECLQCRQRLESLAPLAEGLVGLREAEDVPAPSPELWRQLCRRVGPVLDELSRKHSQPAAQRPVPARRLLPQRSWAAAVSVLLLLAAIGGWLLWSNVGPSAAAAIVETTGPVRIVQPGQPSRYCRKEGEMLNVGDVLTTAEADGAISLDDATRLAMQRGCRMVAQPPVAQREATFALREGSLCVDTTRAKRGCCVQTPRGTVRCGKSKTLISVDSPQECTVTTLEGAVEVECAGHLGVVSSGVCAELKRSKPCCSYRPARPKETQCDWVDRCGQPKEGRKP